MARALCRSPQKWPTRLQSRTRTSSQHRVARRSRSFRRDAYNSRRAGLRVPSAGDCSDGVEVAESRGHHRRWNQHKLGNSRTSTRCAAARPCEPLTDEPRISDRKTAFTPSYKPISTPRQKKHRATMATRTNRIALPLPTMPSRGQPNVGESRAADSSQ